MEVKNNDEKRRDLTLADVRLFYQNKKTHETLKQILSNIAQTESNKPIDNDSYADALELSNFMFLQTKKSLRILTGGYCGDFLDVLKKPFFDALDRILQAGDKAKMIIVRERGVDNELDDKVQKLEEEESERIEIRYGYKDKDTPINHLIIADDTMLRDEMPHGPLVDESIASEIKAEVYLNSPTFNKIRKRNFDELWVKLAP